jgi:peptidoglycan hydrolase-like amidase
MKLHSMISVGLGGVLLTIATAQAIAAPNVPATIRVGYNCSGTSCSTVQVMSLETYVRRGLDDEWVSSWHGESLRAGAVAYRSYGAYRVAHPLSSNYDICSNAYCQVNESDTYTATEAAAIDTAGVILSQDGTTIFFAEYSSENNSWDNPNDGLSCTNTDLSCGNGRNGSPAAGWPCLTDSVGTGYGCFGHGKGMSQWGTQRWAANNGKDWKWIVNHYYNNSGQPAGKRSAFMYGLPSSTPAGTPWLPAVLSVILD